MDTTTRTDARRATTPAALTATPPAAAPTGRHDSYGGIHKALRRFMSDTLGRVGSTDPADADEVAATLAQLRDLLDTCELHIKDENEFIHPALERARPGSAARIAAEHGHHHDAIADLRDLAGLIEDTREPARGAALARLYRAMALFVAENFAHMEVEEAEHNPVLWAHYTDAELIAIERALVASIPPQVMVRMMYWFMPSLNAPERAAMLGDMKAGMPPEPFLGMLDIARRSIAASDFAKLTRALGLPEPRV